MSRPPSFAVLCDRLAISRIPAPQPPRCQRSDVNAGRRPTAGKRLGVLANLVEKALKEPRVAADDPFRGELAMGDARLGGSHRRAAFAIPTSVI
jgi:hypothetical protein